MKSSGLDRKSVARQRIIDTLVRLRKAHKKVTFSLLRSQPGCCPATVASVFSVHGSPRGTELYRRVWALAGMTYEEHTGRKPNDHWKDPKRRRSAIQNMVLELARTSGLSPEQVIHHLRYKDFASKELAALVTLYYDASPEKAVRDAFGIMRGATRNEFSKWPTTAAHLRKFLPASDRTRISYGNFIRRVPGCFAILERWNGLKSVLMRLNGVSEELKLSRRLSNGYWRRRANRVAFVRGIVQAFRNRRKDRTALPTYVDLRRNLRFASMLASTDMTAATLLREAGFDALDPADWSKQSARRRRIRELVMQRGGVSFVTDNYFNVPEPGLIDRITRNIGNRAERGERPRLFFILREGGYQVSPEDYEGRLGGPRYCFSSHGDMNESRAEAACDEWVFAVVGKGHKHRVPYPGAPARTCDFVLLHPRSSSVRRGLWVELVGMTVGENKVAQEYRLKLARKRSMARRLGINWLAMSPPEMSLRSRAVLKRLCRKAPWLATKLQSPRALKAWKRLTSLPSQGAYKYAVQRRRLGTSQILDEIKQRIASFRRTPTKVALSIGACERDPKFRRVIRTVRDLLTTDTSNPNWWGEWLVLAGLPRKQAEHVSRIWRRRGNSRAEVIAQLQDVYRKAATAGSWPGREPGINGGLSRRIHRVFRNRTQARNAAKAGLPA